MAAEQLIILAFALFLLGLTLTIFAWPERARQFLNAFASSARAHYFELVLRTLVGGALILHSPEMWQSRLFWIFGWILVITSIALACIPWQWHQKFAGWVVPSVIRLMPWYGMGTAGLSILLLYGMWAGMTQSTG